MKNYLFKNLKKKKTIGDWIISLTQVPFINEVWVGIKKKGIWNENPFEQDFGVDVSYM